MSNTDKQQSLSRREALSKLAKLSAYTAPTVATLLMSKQSYAAGSGIPPGPQCFTNNGKQLTNRSPNNPRYPEAADLGGNGGGGVGRPNSTADCGIAGANSDA